MRCIAIIIVLGFLQIVLNAQKTDVEDLQDKPQHPMFGLNSWVPAYNPDFDLDWYGSGDWNNDGVIDMKDYNQMVVDSNPLENGTYRGDIDLDGVSGTEADKQIVYDYIEGNRSHINIWELESPTEKINHLQKAIAIDQTDLINPYTSGWECWLYAGQLFGNFNGVYGVENLDPENGTNLTYDFSKNGIFRIPIRLMDTKSTSGIAHQINSVFIPDSLNPDVSDFTQWYKFEPQTDEEVNPGNFSMDENEYANIKYYGYLYSNILQQWLYTSYNFLEYNLSGGDPTLDYFYSNLVTSWTPFDQVSFPEDTVINYNTGINTDTTETGTVGNLYPGTNVEFGEESTQTDDGSCSDVNYEITRTWDLNAGFYDSVYVQRVNVVDTVAPTFDVDSMGVINAMDNSGLELIVTGETNSSQGSDSTQCDYYTYDVTTTWNVSDQCGNNQSKDYIKHNEDLNAPDFDVDENGPYNISDPEGSPVNFETEVISTQGENPNSCDYYTYNDTVRYTGRDACGNETIKDYIEQYEDLNAPTFDFDESGQPINVNDAEGSPVNLEKEVISTQGSDPAQCDYYNYVDTNKWTATDACGNFNTQDFLEWFEDDDKPVYTSFPEDIIVGKNDSITPDYTGYPEWSDPSQSPVTPNYYDEVVSESDSMVKWARYWNGQDVCGNVSNDSVQYITKDLTNGIEGLVSENDFSKIYPNPVKDKITFDYYNQKGTDKLHIDIYSMDGKLVKDYSEEIYSGEGKIDINMSNLKSGVYFLKLTTNYNYDIKKIIKIK